MLLNSSGCIYNVSMHQSLMKDNRSKRSIIDPIWVVNETYDIFAQDSYSKAGYEIGLRELDNN
jgi:hypothetical protein